MTVVIDENIRLAEGYRRGPGRFEGNAHPFQVSVCDAICVKILEAFGYIQQLGRGRIICQVRLQGKTHQADPLHTWVVLEKLQQSSIWHPLRDNFQTVCCDANERDDVRV